MTTVTQGVFIAALHTKLAQAERSLYEFRKIFEHFQESCGEKPVEACDMQESTGRSPISPTRQDGVYPGQSNPPGECST